jgi:CheY-like chemotaxis protein
LFYAEFPLVQSEDLRSEAGPHSQEDNYPHSKIDSETKGFRRLWSWSDPRNQIDHTNLITPMVKKKPMPSSDHLVKVFPSRDHLIAKIDDPQSPEDFRSLPINILIQPQSDPHLAPQSARPSLQILIVDDAKSIRKLLDRALSAQGHTCVTACDGQESIDIINKKSPPPGETGSAARVCPFDLILMDSEMPVMNGPTATKLIRAMGFEQLIILGVTGNVLREDVDMFLRHGVDAVIGKPMNLEMMWKEYDRIAKDKS